MEIFNLPDWAIQGGAVGLLGLAFLMIMFGKLVPGRFYKQLERERDYWRAAALKQQGHTDALMPAAKMNVEFVRGLQAVLGGDHDVADIGVEDLT